MAPNADEVRRQLDRLLASPYFANAGRISRFLRFVVEQSLAGNGERLKEYVIGVEVFDRDGAYDPRVDAIVRVEAARLRSKLTEYYAGEGRGDALVLSLPKGGYAPVIKASKPPVAATNAASLSGVDSDAAVAPIAPPGTVLAVARRVPFLRLRAWLVVVALAAATTLAVGAWAPWAQLKPGAELRVAVLPFTPYPDHAGLEAEAIAMRITEGVSAELVRDGRFAVVASSAARAALMGPVRPRDVAAKLDADVLVEARVTTDGRRIRVEARAADGMRERKFWVDNFAGDAGDTDALEHEIAAALGAALGAAKPAPN
jgi:adenylate cyclase